jgi:ethanolamine utilization protein EutA
MADEGVRRAIARRLATLAVDQIVVAPLDNLGRALQLTEPLERSVQPELLSFSGGVAEYIFHRETADHGDIAKDFADEIVRQLKERSALPVIEPAERIRATVIGASQFTVQVSGKTIYLSHDNLLPVNNIPVVHLGLDLSDDIDEDAIVDAFRRNADILDLTPDAKIALAFTFSAEPDYPSLAAIARSVMRFAAPTGHRGELLVLMIDGDICRGLGRIIHEELGLEGRLISVDGIRLQQLDFVDIGELIDPPGVVPVVIKSLLFS